MTLSKKVIIINDRPLVREGMRALIEKSFPDSLIHGFDRSPSGPYLQANPPDLIIVSFGKNGCSILELLAVYDNGSTHPPILVCSAQLESSVAPFCVRAGANGFVSKYATTEEFTAAVTHMLAGGNYFNSRDVLVAENLNTVIPFEMHDEITHAFSPREKEVFSWIAQGLPVRSIAPRLGISVKTVETHRENIKHKLGLKNAQEVAAAAREWADGLDIPKSAG